MAGVACAQQPTSVPPQAAPEDSASNPDLDAELFYEILLGEINARVGEGGTGYALMLEAARRTGNPQLFQRAADMALQARSGEYALAAAKAWREAQPDSREANRYVLQILIALNRVGETAELLRQELAQAPVQAKPAILGIVPQMYARVSDKALAATVVEQALVDELTKPGVAAAAHIAVGRVRLAAGDKTGALASARASQALDAASEGPARLGMELLEDGVPEGEALVSRYFASQPQSTPEMQMAYSRVLLGQQKYAEAKVQLEAVTAAKPDLPEPWLILSTLQLQDNRLDLAETSLKRFLSLLDTPDANKDARQRSLNQAYLLYAQIAEKRGDFAAAEGWLARIENSSELFSAQSRRASLLARQGKMAQARALLRNLPGVTEDDRRMKLLAEVQLLRDQRQFKEAYEVQTELVALAPEDGELLYDQAMLAEKIGQFDTMEKLLRQIIARQPDYHHAYNALGYSFAERGQRLPEARQLIAKALELAPGDPFITDSLGWVEFRMGNKAKARSLLETAFKARPDAEIAAHLGEVVWSLGERDKALGIWREGLRLNPENDSLKDTLKRLGAKP
jgi:tetratricopeptide (TPR) repeat protein